MNMLIIFLTFGADVCFCYKCSKSNLSLLLQTVYVCFAIFCVDERVMICTDQMETTATGIQGVVLIKLCFDRSKDLFWLVGLNTLFLLGNWYTRKNHVNSGRCKGDNPAPQNAGVTKCYIILSCMFCHQDQQTTICSVYQLILVLACLDILQCLQFNICLNIPAVVVMAHFRLYQ